MIGIKKNFAAENLNRTGKNLALFAILGLCAGLSSLQMCCMCGGFWNVKLLLPVTSGLCVWLVFLKYQLRN